MTTQGICERILKQTLEVLSLQSLQSLHPSLQSLSQTEDTKSEVPPRFLKHQQTPQVSEQMGSILQHIWHLITHYPA